jgi:hypothetical protein
VRWPWRRNSVADEAALADARRHLSEVRDQWPDVHEAAATMRYLKKRNHFAETIEAIYAGRRS